MKPSEIPDIDVSLVDKAVSLWQKGELVAIPTETVYGLAADATRGEAVARIYAVKGRPQFNPLIVHVADAAMAKPYVVWNDRAEALAGAYWPGPLTLVLPRRADCPISDLVSAGGDTLAVRVPAHPVTRSLLKAFGKGIAAPSANKSGRVSPTTAAHVREEFGAEEVPLVIDGGPCAVGVESTVIDLTGATPTILRPGAVTQAMVEAVIGSVSSGQAPPGDHALKSPGQLASHYAPSIPLRMNVRTVEDEEALLAFGPEPLAGAATTLNLSERGDLLEAAANLFGYLRALDNGYHRAIAVMPIPAEGIGAAINDRLTRASVR